jgi:hypothetical protein
MLYPLFSCCVQSNLIQAPPPESFLILLFRYWQPFIRVLPRDFHLFLFRCFPQLVLRAKLRTPFLVPECAQPAFCLNREEFHVSVRLITACPCTLTSCSSSRMHTLCAAVTTSFCPRHPRSGCGQLSPLTVLHSSCFHFPHAPSDIACTPPFSCIHTSASAVHKGMCQSLPEWF